MDESTEPAPKEDDKDEGLSKFSQDMARAIEEGILATQKTWRIPLTSITIGWSRMELERDQARKHLIEVRLWWPS